MEILYINDDILFAIKPVGVNSEDGAAEMLKEQTGGQIYPLHRLDTSVSGVMIFARNKKSAAYCSKLIAQNNMTKTYIAVIAGKPAEGAGRYEDWLFKDSRKNKSFVVKRERKGVKKAVLNYETLESTNGENGILSLVKITLVTGRSHQIRVQFSSRGTPLAGDGKYGSREKCPIALFSHKISVGGTEQSAVPDLNIYPWNLFKEKIEKM